MTEKTEKTDTILRRGWSVFGKLVAGTRKGPPGDRVRQLKKLQKQFGLRFLDLSLLEQALTHRSYSHVTSRTRDASNERMEFLGDSVLGLSVSQFLYLQFPDRPEGALSKMKSLLVSRKVLSEVSREIGLGEFILLSGEESEMGGRDRDSILADSFEGVIGAIYLDQGYRAASKFINDTLLARIPDILKDEGHTNYKSLLQEYVQSRRLSHPVYRVHAEDGPEHEKEFAVEVVVKGDVWGLGRGKNKKDAEQAAARAALDGQKRKTASPASAPSSRAAASPRAGKWRTSTTSPPERTAAGDEGSAAPAVGEDLRHGIRASRELMRTSRESRPADTDDRNVARRQAERLERDARGEVSGTERRGERSAGRGTDRRRTEERAGSVRREPEARRRRPVAPRRDPAARRADVRREDARREDVRRERREAAPAGTASAGEGTDLGMTPGMEAPAFGAPETAAPSGGRRRGRRGGRGRGRSSGLGASAGAASVEPRTTPEPFGEFAPELVEDRAPSMDRAPTPEWAPSTDRASSDAAAESAVPAEVVRSEAPRSTESRRGSRVGPRPLAREGPPLDAAEAAHEAPREFVPRYGRSSADPRPASSAARPVPAPLPEREPDPRREVRPEDPGVEEDHAAFDAAPVGGDAESEGFAARRRRRATRGKRR